MVEFTAEGRAIGVCGLLADRAENYTQCGVENTKSAMQCGVNRVSGAAMREGDVA